MAPIADGMTGRAMRAPVKAANIKIKREVRLDSGIDAGWNTAVGGGFPETATYLVSGTAGVGKTTLLMKIAGRIAELKNRPALYISSEMREEKVAKHGHRIGANLDLIYIWHQVEFQGIDEQIDRIGPSCVVYDSVPMFDCNTTNGAEADRTVARSGRRAADRHDAIVFLMQHVTKAGIIGGTKRLQHEVDGVIFVRPRFLQVSKHRFGPAMKAQRWCGLKTVCKLASKGREEPAPAKVIRIEKARSA